MSALTLHAGSDTDEPVIGVSGAFDAAAVARFGELVRDANGTDGDLHVDLTDAHDVTVAGVEALAAAAVQLGRVGRRMILVGTPGILQHVLRLGLGDLLTAGRASSRNHASRGAARRLGVV